MALIRNRPCPVGIAAGAEIARLIAGSLASVQARFPDHPDPCHSCAFRAGSVPNGCAATIGDAIKCLMEWDTFNCHERKLPDGEPEVCAGWAAAMIDRGDDARPVEMPWDYSDEWAAKEEAKSAHENADGPG